MRKLARIERVKKLSPIKKADLIECADIQGWSCVVEKGEFTAGDLCVYFEIDSFLPIEERFEFLRKSCYRKLPDQEGFRLRTMKLRGQISQGLILPLATFPELPNHVSVGLDVSNLLKITKYEAPISITLSGEMIGGFPGFISKTDQERLQNLPEYFKECYSIEFEETTKLDGTSMTIFHRDGYIGVCGRNYELKNTGKNTLWQVVKDSGIDTVLPEFGNMALQGELMGPSIQSNKEKLGHHRFFLFDIFDIDRGVYWSSKTRLALFSKLKKRLDTEVFTHVPVVKIFKPFEQMTTIEAFLQYVDGRSIYAAIREGSVFKSTVPVDGRLISFKVINNRFLLKYE